MEKMRIKARPKDNVLDFYELQSSKSSKIEKDNEIFVNKLIQFESLPISGWHDEIDTLDSKCRQSCVKDCSCVYHCSWVVA